MGGDGGVGDGEGVSVEGDRVVVLETYAENF